MERFTALGAVLAGLILVFGAYYVANPEHATLDASVRAAAGGQYVTLSQGITHYDISGPADGAPVVLVHGFSVPFYIWDSTAVALSGAGYRVLRYDLFGRALMIASTDSTSWVSNLGPMAPRRPPQHATRNSSGHFLQLNPGEAPCPDPVVGERPCTGRSPGGKLETGRRLLFY